MKLLRQWQYKYIERCLYDYRRLQEKLSSGAIVDTEAKIIMSIERALEFFKGTMHEQMMREYYFNVDHYRSYLSNQGHYSWVCESVLHTEQPNGYVIRREIVYKVAMNAYLFGLFTN